MGVTSWCWSMEGGAVPLPMLPAPTSGADVAESAQTPLADSFVKVAAGMWEVQGVGTSEGWLLQQRFAGGGG